MKLALVVPCYNEEEVLEIQQNNCANYLINYLKKGK